MLLSDIEMISIGDQRLRETSLEKLKSLKNPVHIQVFVIPTCPYCTNAVSLGHALAYANDNIRADMVEATEFPHLSHKYDVCGVPRVINNETYHFEGALPEEIYLEHVVRAGGAEEQKYA